MIRFSAANHLQKREREETDSEKEVILVDDQSFGTLLDGDDWQLRIEVTFPSSG